ncbi:MAG: hypothetical protein GF333_01190 [Candidatus Omnitrophica bacterium]|nr:hypothetical protein [Candidatus Omnitrophota bacterium]
MESIHTLVGVIAGTLCAVSFLPQVIRILRTRNTRDLSFVTFSMFALGVFFWLVYGILLREPPMIAANGFILALALVILAMKVKYG